MIPILKYLYVSNLDYTSSVGYDSKIVGQARGLAKDSVCGLITFNTKRQVVIRCIDKSGEISQYMQVIKPWSESLFIRRIYLLQAALEIIDKHKNSLIYLYLRYPRSDPLYILFLTIVRSLYGHINILCEYPTFPYDREEVSSNYVKSLLIKILDYSTRLCLRFFISKAIAIDYSNKIFGIPVITIQNGITVEDFPIRKPQYDPLSIHLLGVANVRNYHGYDRVIRGLAEYYDTGLVDMNVFFHVVGINVSDSENLIRLSETSHVDQYIIFYSQMIGNDLNTLFNSADIAISTLGAHRIGLKQLSPLKSREYCVRGIPFIIGYEDLDFPSSFSYCRKVEPSNKSIFIPELIEFSIQMRKEKDHPSKMRKYAQNKLDWAMKMKCIN